MSKEKFSQSVEAGEMLADRSIPLEDRIELARNMVKEISQVTVFLSRRGVADGTGFSDISDEELKRITDELGFEDGTYKTISAYEWHTPSKIHNDLVLQVIEGPLDVGGPSELFPNGRAWSQYDNVDTVNILVSKIDK